uniref:Sepiapterin reductase n=1 Tax=Salarias fasciatus TaxID=181472 RepID=A0A672J1F1_SALFA
MSVIHSENLNSLGRSLCIITGAWKGFGRALTHRVVYLLRPGSVLLLVARSAVLLQELQSFCEEQQLLIQCITADLSTKDGVNETVRGARQQAANELDHVLPLCVILSETVDNSNWLHFHCPAHCLQSFL